MYHILKTLSAHKPVVVSVAKQSGGMVIQKQMRNIIRLVIMVKLKESICPSIKTGKKPSSKLTKPLLFRL